MTLFSICKTQPNNKSKLEMFSLLRRCSGWLVRRLEDVCAWYGEFVAVRALIMMASCVVVTGLVLIGMIDYTTENNAFKLWIPDNSDFVKNFQWLEENSPPDIRFNSLILSSEQTNKWRRINLHNIFYNPGAVMWTDHST